MRGNRMQLIVKAGQSTFAGKNATTRGWLLLGPAVQLHKGKSVTVDIRLTNWPNTTLHWHGLEFRAHRRRLDPQGIIPAEGGTRTIAALRRKQRRDLPGFIRTNTAAKPGARWRWALPGWC